jgi:CBS domain-containing protein
VLGSGGRGESLLAADQDNAIIFAEGEVGGAEDRWFAELGKRIADTLNTAGIPYCQGGVMAKNAPWRGSVELWRKRIRHWVGRSDPQDLLNVDIFFDQRPVHGHPALATDLFDYAFEWGHASPAFAKLLGDRLGGFGTPFTLFGGLRTSEGRIDLKKHGLFAIVSVARALAIRHDIRQHGTKARLEGLLARQIGSPDSVRALLEHHALLMSLLLSQQSQDLTQGIPVSNSIAPDRLSARQRDRLKEALHVTSHMDNLFRSLVTALPPAPSST